MIQVDKDDIMVSCLNIPDSQLPSELLAFIENHEPYVYMNTNDLKEHMYTLDSLEDAIDNFTGIEVYWRPWLNDIQEAMNKYSCAYFRIIYRG